MGYCSWHLSCVILLLQKQQNYMVTTETTTTTTTTTKIGEAFSLTMIMLQTNSSLCLSLLPYNIGVKRVESITQAVLNIQTNIMTVNKYTCKGNFEY